MRHVCTFDTLLFDSSNRHSTLFGRTRDRWNCPIPALCSLCLLPPYLRRPFVLFVLRRPHRPFFKTYLFGLQWFFLHQAVSFFPLFWLHKSSSLASHSFLIFSCPVSSHSWKCSRHPISANDWPHSDFPPSFRIFSVSVVNPVFIWRRGLPSQQSSKGGGTKFVVTNLVRKNRPNFNSHLKDFDQLFPVPPPHDFIIFLKVLCD